MPKLTEKLGISKHILQSAVCSSHLRISILILSFLPPGVKKLSQSNFKMPFATWNPPESPNIIVLSLGLSCTNASCTFDFSISNLACPAEYNPHL